MAENVYEGLVILDSNRYARDAAGTSGKVAAIVEKCGGTVLVSRIWDERRLAYPIGPHRKGTYWLTYFRVDSLQLAAIRRELQLADEVVRSLILKIHPGLVDDMLRHAVASDDKSEDAAPDSPQTPADDAAVAVADGTASGDAGSD